MRDLIANMVGTISMELSDENLMETEMTTIIHRLKEENLLSEKELENVSFKLEKPPQK